MPTKDVVFSVQDLCWYAHPVQVLLREVLVQEVQEVEEEAAEIIHCIAVMEIINNEKT